MAEPRWLTLIGLGEDGLEGLPAASLAALNAAEIVMAPARHLGLLPDGPGERITWPVPFAEGIDQLLSLRGREVAVLVSGDPFWFGAGTVLTRHLAPGEWHALPGPSCFSLAASRLGWPLETTACLALHAAPLARLRPLLAPGQRCLVTLRDGAAPALLAAYLVREGFGDSQLHILQALGGPRERIETLQADALTSDEAYLHPLCVAMEIAGKGDVLPAASGRADTWFENDGQITKQPVRALTLSALAPAPGEHLWDIGGGSGSIAIEWLLAHPSLTATSIEANPARAAQIHENAGRLGQDRLHVVTGTAPTALSGLAHPDAVFVGGGLTAELLAFLNRIGGGFRIVANAVTLEAEALLTDAHQRFGGELLRVELARAAPLGSKRGWRAAFPIVQWSARL